MAYTTITRMPEKTSGTIDYYNDYLLLTGGNQSFKVSVGNLKDFYSNILTTDVMDFTNKTIDDISNNVYANAVHLKAKAFGDLTYGDVVSVHSSSTSDSLVVEKADNTVSAAIGIVKAFDMDDGTEGLVLTSGIFDNIDTSAFAQNDLLYVNGAGTLTNVAPEDGIVQQVALAINIGTSGNILTLFGQPRQTSTEVDYDNLTSGILATNLQDAVDELAYNLDTEIIRTEKMEIVSDYFVLPRPPVGVIISDGARIFDNLLDPSFVEYSCVIMNGITCNFEPADNLNGKYAVIEYLAIKIP